MSRTAGRVLSIILVFLLIFSSGGCPIDKLLSFKANASEYHENVAESKTTSEQNDSYASSGTDKNNSDINDKGKDKDKDSKSKQEDKSKEDTKSNSDESSTQNKQKDDNSNNTENNNVKNDVTSQDKSNGSRKINDEKNSNYEIKVGEIQLLQGEAWNDIWEITQGKNDILAIATTWADGKLSANVTGLKEGTGIVKHTLGDGTVESFTIKVNKLEIPVGTEINVKSIHNDMGHYWYTSDLYAPGEDPKPKIIGLETNVYEINLGIRAISTGEVELYHVNSNTGQITETYSISVVRSSEYGDNYYKIPNVGGRITINGTHLSGAPFSGGFGPFWKSETPDVAEIYDHTEYDINVKIISIGNGQAKIVHSFIDGLSQHKYEMFVVDVGRTVTHSVTYNWGDFPPAGKTLYDENGNTVNVNIPATQSYETGEHFNVDSTYTQGMTLYEHDRYGQKIAKYVFSGWDKTGEQTVGDSDITINGSWSKSYNYQIYCYWLGKSYPIMMVVDDIWFEVGNVINIDNNVIQTISGYTYVYAKDINGNIITQLTISDDTSSNVINLYYKKDITVTPNDNSKTYGESDPTPLTNGVATSINLPSGSTVTANYERQQGEAVGDYTLSIEENSVVIKDKNGNDITESYAITLETGIFTINQAKIEVTITGNTDNEVYNGNKQRVEGYNVTDISNPLYTADDFSFSGIAKAEGTDAGTYEMGLEADQFTNNNDNFEVTFNITDGWLKIDKRQVTLTSGSAEKVYDGTALTNDEITVGGDGFVQGEEPTYNFTGSQIDVGSSQNLFTWEWSTVTRAVSSKADNYNINPVYGILNVTPKNLTVKTNEEQVTYDGTEHKANGTILEDLPDGYTYTAKSLQGLIDVGTLNTECKEIHIYDAQGNDVTSAFEITYEEGNISVIPAELTIKTESAQKDYDGQPLTAPGTIEGLVNGETVTFTVTGSQADIGESINIYKLVWDGTAKESNYKITEELGTLTVKKAEDHGNNDQNNDNQNNVGNGSSSNGNAQGSKTGEDQRDLNLAIALSTLSAVAIGLLTRKRRSN